MIDLEGLFPGAQGRPINAINLDSKPTRYSSKRYGDVIVKNKPASTIGKLQKLFWNKNNQFGPLSYAICSSFPHRYRFVGSFTDRRYRIGNSVPPMLMKAIATQINHKLWGGMALTPYPETMKYTDILEAAWQDHLKPKADDAPTVISTFAGGGGSSLGYSMAGYRELLAVEWDNNAVETFKLNFPEIPVYHGDIAKLSVKECMKLAELSEVGELDLFDGSPPCQGFSTAGKRIMNDPRNQLFREYIRLLRGLKPKVFVMENVSGMVKGKMKLVFVEILKELKASGYRVKVKLLNAMYFNVPQSRQRLIFIGVRDDLGIEPSHPKTENKPIIVRDAFNNVPDFQIAIPDYNTKTGQCCRKLKPGQSGEDLFGKNWGFQLIRLKWNQIAPTISKGSGATGFIHPILSRKVSGGELKRLGSFPDKFQFVGSRNKIQDRIGNSVPPLLARAIGNHTRQIILLK